MGFPARIVGWIFFGLMYALWEVAIKWIYYGYLESIGRTPGMWEIALGFILFVPALGFMLSRLVIRMLAREESA